MQTGIEICREIGDQAGKATGNTTSSDLRLCRGDGKGAAAAARAALACEATRDAASIRSTDHTNLGAALLLTGDLDEPELGLRAAAQLAERTQQAHALADLALYFAIAAGLRGADRRAAALHVAHQALTARTGVAPEACAMALAPQLEPATRRMSPRRTLRPRPSSVWPSRLGRSRQPCWDTTWPEALPRVEVSAQSARHHAAV